MSGWPEAGSGSSAGVGEITDGTNAATGNVKVDSPLNTITTVVTPGPGGPLALDINFQGELVDTIQWGLNDGDIGAGLTSELATLYGTTPYVAKVQLQGGSLFSSTSVAIPSGCNLEGAGWSTTAYLSPTDNADCDTISITGSAEWWVLKNFQIAQEATQTLADWHSGITIDVTTAGNFDANGLLDRVYIKNRTGEALYMAAGGHGETVVNNSLLTNSGGAGWFLGNYDCEGASDKMTGNGTCGCWIADVDQMLVTQKSYNNGLIAQYNNIYSTGSATVWNVGNFAAWNANGTFTLSGTTGAWTTAAIAYNASAATIAAAVAAVAGTTCTGTGGPLGTGTGVVTLTFGASQATLTVTQSQNFTVGQATVFAGAIWIAQNVLAGYSGNPSTDTTNWTYPQRPMMGAGRGTANACPDWGYGWYVTAGWVGFQGSASENANGGMYLKNVTLPGIWDLNVNSISAVPGTGAVYAINPLNAAALTLDGSSNQQFRVAANTNNAVQYLLRLINGATNNEVHITSDGGASILSPDSVPILGSGNKVIYNGFDLSLTPAKISQVGSIVNGFEATAGVNTFSFTTQNVGDLVVFASATSGGAAHTITAMTTTAGTGNTGPWTQVWGGVVGGGAYNQYVWVATVTAVGAITINMTMSSTAGAGRQQILEFQTNSGTLVAQPFSSNTGASPSNGPAKTAIVPSLYFMLATGDGSSSTVTVGSTPGFTYQTVGAATDVLTAFNTAAISPNGQGVVDPAFTGSGTCYSVGGLIVADPGAQSGGGTGAASLGYLNNTSTGSYTISTTTAGTAVDSTNLELAGIVAPSSGIVEVTVQLLSAAGTVAGGAALIGLVTHGTTTQVCSKVNVGGQSGIVIQSAPYIRFVVTGLTPATTYNWDLAAWLAGSGDSLVLYGPFTMIARAV